MGNSGGTKLKDSKPQEVLETNELKAIDHWNDVPIADGPNLSVLSSGFRSLGLRKILLPLKSTMIEVNVSASEGVAVKEDELEIEAAKCLEVCNVSGLYFKATNEEVRRRFKVMGKRDRSHRWFDYWAEDRQLVRVVMEGCRNKKGLGIGTLLKECKSISREWIISRRSREPESISELERRITEIENDIACRSDASNRSCYIDLQALWADVTPAFTDVVASPIRLSSVQPRPKILEVHGWIASVKGSVKFNTDGTVEGSYGEAGIGGCLRDDNSKTLLYFSMSVGVNNVVSTEILAIKEALRLYNSLKGSHSYTVVIESDNQSVVGWLQHPHLAPVNIREETIGCINECKDLDCRFQFVSREGNTVADGLAKKGIRRVQPLVMSCLTGSNWTDKASLNA
ncbi:hypothetical protein V6N13_125969 [Hibiscus sabdariffa]